MIPYLLYIYISYKQLGFKDYYFIYCLPPSNISPFMFTLSIFTLFLPKKINKFIFLVYSNLIVGMLFSPILSDVYWISQNNIYHILRTLDSFSHVMLSLFGIYLVLTKQVEVTKKSFFISLILMYSLVLVMIILNIIFNTEFFGLAFNGHHHIYQIVLTSSPILNIIYYICGLFLVLLASYSVENIISKKLL